MRHIPAALPSIVPQPLKTVFVGCAISGVWVIFHLTGARRAEMFASGLTEDLITLKIFYFSHCAIALVMAHNRRVRRVVIGRCHIETVPDTLAGTAKRQWVHSSAVALTISGTATPNLLRLCSLLVNGAIRRSHDVSFMLEKHWERLLKEITACEIAVREIEIDLRIRAMANNVNERELALLRRLKDEKADLLYRYLNLREAFIALLYEKDLAAG